MSKFRKYKVNKCDFLKTNFLRKIPPSPLSPPSSVLSLPPPLPPPLLFSTPYFLSFILISYSFLPLLLYPIPPPLHIHPLLSPLPLPPALLLHRFIIIFPIPSPSLIYSLLLFPSSFFLPSSSACPHLVLLISLFLSSNQLLSLPLSSSPVHTFSFQFPSLILNLFLHLPPPLLLHPFPSPGRPQLYTLLPSLLFCPSSAPSSPFFQFPYTLFLFKSHLILVLTHLRSSSSSPSSPAPFIPYFFLPLHLLLGLLSLPISSSNLPYSVRHPLVERYSDKLFSGISSFHVQRFFLPGNIKMEKKRMLNI